MSAEARASALRGAVAIALAAIALTGAAARAAASAPDPTADIPVGSLPAACEAAGTGPTCEHAAVAALDRDRRAVGLRPYRLPAGFVKMPPAHQWLILANLDRAAYSFQLITGTAMALNRVARAGALARQDPDPWPLLHTLHGQTTIGFGSNWAGGQANALLAYYGWMYDDGVGSGNIDCHAPSDPGCWGHRHNILAFPHAAVLTMGAAAPSGTASYALTIVETSTAPWPFAYRGHA